ncbi:hypothetical protein [Enterobacter sp. SLBN-59]|uniref:hypothetical protein n=1 Tax=Enterobacter sp. SLBN-59 TaxID=2940621 RepID=UPI002167C82E|nr:hypothetical protein [Enterobacter sp. SLBN-59]MCS3490505.1 hypothetical protein [Enterobacter sp. SLBN-59]
MKLTLKEMNGLLNGKCLPSDLIVGETLAEYLVRKFAEADAKCAALAAENAGLKSAHPQPFGPVMMKALDAYEKHQDEVPETGMLDAFFILRDSIRVDTAATDAFLAEVRASAVDEACLKISNAIVNCYQDEQIGLDEAATICGDFAAQIRKERRE